MTAPKNTPQHFLDEPPIALESADSAPPTVRLFLAPIEVTTSYMAGTANAPAAILRASDQVEFYDMDLRRTPCAETRILTDHTLVEDIERHNRQKDLDGSLEMLGRAARRALSEGEIPIAIGGEHTLSLPMVEAVATQLQEPVTIVQIDAHADLRAEYQGRELCHATVYHKISQHHAVLQIGVRAISEPEQRYADAASPRIRMVSGHTCSAEPAWQEEALGWIPTDAVYLSVDFDGLDPSIMPAVGTPVPGGLDWHTTVCFLQKLFEQKRVVGGDFVELCPMPNMTASEFVAAQLIYRCIGLGYGPL